MSGSGLPPLEKELQTEVQKAQGVQKEIQRSVAAHGQLEIQLNENRIVEEELTILSEDARVFKLVGPLLVRQDLMEARDIVSKRLEYIDGEMKRHDKAIKEAEGAQDKCRHRIAEIQSEYQSLSKK